MAVEVEYVRYGVRRRRSHSLIVIFLILLASPSPSFSQGKLLEAITDFNTAISMAPYAVDPVLNRGVALEALKDYPAAREDYIVALEASRGKDPAAWNNLGNVAGAMGDWKEVRRE